jgi:uncharacterized membrane protein YphA (DoxX/SURF4 family)
MKIRQIAYWITTALTAAVFLSGGAGELARPAPLMEGMARLGYPAYFVTILGIWKILGGIAILIPKTPRLKEWAYAGMFFDLSGAAISHAASGEQPKIAAPLIILAIVIASWTLRPQSRKLNSV